MKKIILTGFLLSALLLSGSVFAEEQISQVNINGKSIDVRNTNVKVDGKILKSDFSPYISSGRTFVPIRELVEGLGAEVKWDNLEKSALIKFEKKEIKLKIDSKVSYISGKKIILNESSIPKLAKYNEPKEETKTMVPLRFVSEALGYKVDWNSEENLAVITTEKAKDSDLITDDNSGTKENNSEKKSKKRKKDLSLVNNQYISNSEKKEMNNAKKSNRISAYKAAGLSEDEYNIDPGKRKITKTIKKEGPLTIVIDPGHGGKDPGANSSVISSINEKELTLKVAEKLYEKLQATDYEVLMTRNSDEYIKLLDRAQLSNENNSELFLSIHFNSSDENKSAKGIEVLYASEKNVIIKTAEQKHFAKCLLNSLIDITGSSSRGIKNRPDLIVLNKTKNVSALAELGFLSNSSDMDSIMNDEYLDLLAQGLFNGIQDYVNNYVE
ncbi:N-acetylmuramoyl-L-alanine amidase [Peptoniphilus koenoeneniae]|uniref:N-acetylmuramoyl-L-alanine amidase n=1 Tax=Peptoniphilus koenoeneniae TaxID=507751 RepID=A0ABU0ASH1_9FIRM|nr:MULTISPECIES: N-acetylmuramoyl-L-alanine amidase [Peptoniphilus]ERT56831.1 N-acetylmuramoyl-L-alanine amidase [Peptoniphilus sp. BV3C26]MDQ0274211.1 N-acetylmuramoyl-L-alanine amidase [Peptoniphilus koenoeneniae]